MQINESRSFRIALATGLITLAIAGTAAAAAWREASWGRGWATVVGVGSFYLDRIDGQTDDLATDGYCVYARFREAGKSWPGEAISGSKSCGAAVTFVAAGTHVLGVRLYREDGRYLTLYGN